MSRTDGTLDTGRAAEQWDELQGAIAACDAAWLSFEMDEVLRRVERDGDLSPLC